MSVKRAFQSFLDNDFEKACISSTKAGWSGSGYSVEFFDDGTYRVLWDSNIGNMYDSPGLILNIPQLSDEEYDEENEEYFFDNCRELIEENFKQHYQANLNIQAIIADS